MKEIETQDWMWFLLGVFLVIFLSIGIYRNNNRAFCHERDERPPMLHAQYWQWRDIETTCHQDPLWCMQDSNIVFYDSWYFSKIKLYILEKFPKSSTNSYIPNKASLRLIRQRRYNEKIEQPTQIMRKIDKFPINHEWKNRYVPNSSVWDEKMFSFKPCKIRGEILPASSRYY